MKVNYIPPAPPPSGEVTIVLSEEEAQLLHTLCMYGVRWDAKPLGELAHKLYYALQDTVPSLDDGVSEHRPRQRELCRIGNAFRASMGKWFEENRFFWRGQ